MTAATTHTSNVLTFTKTPPPDWKRMYAADIADNRLREIGSVYSRSLTEIISWLRSGGYELRPNGCVVGRHQKRAVQAMIWFCGTTVSDAELARAWKSPSETPVRDDPKPEDRTATRSGSARKRRRIMKRTTIKNTKKSAGRKVVKASAKTPSKLMKGTKSSSKAKRQQSLASKTILNLRKRSHLSWVNLRKAAGAIKEPFGGRGAVEMTTKSVFRRMLRETKLTPKQLLAQFDKLQKVGGTKQASAS